MRPEQWKLVEQLLEAALEQPPAARQTFLTAACDADDELRREVDPSYKPTNRPAALLLNRSSPVFRRPTITPTTRDDKLPSLDGTRIGAYKIERELVRGGLGWERLPKDYPPWKTVCHYFRAWR